MSQALVLALVAVFVCDGFIGRGKWLAASAAGVVAGVTFLTKQEFGVAAAAGIAAITVLSPALAVRDKIRSLLASGVLFVVTYFGILGIALHGDSFAHLFAANILWPWAKIPPPWQGLYRRILGLDDPAARLIEAGNSLIDILAFGGTAWFFLYLKDLRARARVGAGIALAAIWALWWWRWTEGSHFRPMTLTLPVIVASSLFFVFRRRKVEGTNAAEGASAAEGAGPFLALALGALVLLQREGYRGAIEAYYSGMGYVLAVPIAAPLIWRAIRGPRTAGRSSLAAASAFILAIGWFGVGRLQALQRNWRKTTPIATGRGTVFVSNDMAPVLASTAEFLEANTSPGDPILMMPQTYGLDFLLDRRNLLFFIWISPGYLTDEPELIVRCRATPPAAVVIFEGSFGVFHSGQFGHGFADALVGWLDANFPRQEAFGQGTILRGRRLLPRSQRQ
jgi:hypothetical protein